MTIWNIEGLIQLHLYRTNYILCESKIANFALEYVPIFLGILSSNLYSYHPLFFSRIVGDEDGGTLFTPAQYEQYKKRVVPQRMNNRLYVSFGVPGEGLECKLVGPETQCFCSHRYYFIAHGFG